MQRCPKCNRSYQDDSQKFCTFDGGRLMVDADAPTTFDLGPAPPTDPLGATITGPSTDLNKTVVGTQGPLTSEIPASVPTGPTNTSVPTWQGDPQASTPPPPATPAPTGPTTTSPLSAPPVGAPQAGPSTAPNSGGLGQTSAAGFAQPSPVANAPAPQSGAPGAYTATAPRRGSNPMLFVVGGLAVLLLLVIAGGAGFYFLAMKPRAETSNNNSGGGSGPTLEKDSSATNANANSSNTNTAAATTSSQPPVQAPPNSTRFVNSRDKVTGSLAEHFVDFSFYYPNSWIVDTKAGTSGSSNFFKANRMLSDDTGDYLLESLAVGWYQSNGTMQFDRPIFPNRVEFFNNLFSKEYPNYQKVSEGETKLNGLDGYQFTFKGLVKDTGKGDINLWGRVIFLPAGNEDSRNGVVLLMLASSAAPEIRSASDVGENGDLATILKTFRLGPSQ